MSSVEKIVHGHRLKDDHNFRQWIAAGVVAFGPDAEPERVLEFAEAGWNATASQAESDRERAKPFIANERRRIRAIVWSEAGKANPPMADFLAFQTDVDAATAVRALEALSASDPSGQPS